MALFSISYDLIANKDYERLSAGIKRLCPTWSRPLASMWLVQWSGTATTLRDAVARYMDDDDKLLVASVGATAWRNLGKTVGDWIHDRAA